MTRLPTKLTTIMMNMNSPDYANMETQDPTGMFPDLRALRRKEEEEMQQHNNYDARDVVLSQYMNLTRVGSLAARPGDFGLVEETARTRVNN